MKCVACNSVLDNTSKVYKVKEMMLGTGDVFDYVECKNCGTLQISDIPNDLSLYYPDDYYSFSNELDSETLKSFLIKCRNSALLGHGGFLGKILAIFKDDVELRNLSPYLTNGDAILDVGCGDGKLLRKLNTGCYKKLVGVDPFLSDDLDIKGKIKIYKKNIFDVTDKFDVVMFNHSFEHMQEPIKILQKCRTILKDNGRVIIRIPTTSSFAWEKYRENWVQLDSPRHLYLYSRSALELLASQSGMELISTVYDSDEFQFIGSEQYLKGISLFSPKSYYPNQNTDYISLKEISEYKVKARELNLNNLGDQAIFVLKCNEG